MERKVSGESLTVNELPMTLAVSETKTSIVSPIPKSALVFMRSVVNNPTLDAG